jgi:hypothetical protein
MQLPNSQSDVADDNNPIIKEKNDDDQRGKKSLNSLSITI